MKFYIPGIILMLIITSCGPTYLFNKSQEIGKAQWTYDNIIGFEFNVQDTTKIYKLILELEHSTEFSNQNLYTKIHTHFPGGEKIEEVVSLELANKAGFWFGDCNSEYCTLEIPIQPGAFFNQAGDYRIEVEQFMREELVEGIRSVGFKIEETGEQR